MFCALPTAILQSKDMVKYIGVQVQPPSAGAEQPRWCSLVPGCLAPARPGADYELRNSSSRPACNEWGRGTGTAAPGPTRCTYVE